MPAAATGTYNIDQLLRTPIVQGVRSRIAQNGTVFQRFLGLGPNTATEPAIAAGHQRFFWEYFDHTRTVGGVRPYNSGPGKPIPKAAGIASGVLMRFYESLDFDANKVAGYRVQGKPIGYVNSNGAAWIAKQMKYLFERHQNQLEFVCSRMLRGGFDIKLRQAAAGQTGGNSHAVVESGSGDIAVDYQIPANHKSQIALLAGATNVITATWATASTDLILHHANMRLVSERETGMVLRHGWINSTNYVNLVNNEKLRAAGGSAFKVWDMVQTARIPTLDGMRESGETVEFRGLPGWTYHVYDGVLNVDQDRDSLAEADSSLFIPSDKVIWTPDPGDWAGKYIGKEVVKEDAASQMKEVEGFHHWKRQEYKPVPRWELHLLDNYLPVLYVPKAVYYATVTGF
jgi:hypothetical protein